MANRGDAINRTSGLIGVVALLAAGSAAWLSLGKLPAPPAMSSSAPLAACSAAPPHLVPWSVEPAGTWNGRSGKLVTVASLVMTVCQAGELTFKVNAPVVRGWGALLLVNLDAERVAQTEIRGPQILRLKVPRAGTLRVSFPNDLYVADGRTLYITRLSLQGAAACPQGTRNARVSPNLGVWHGQDGALYTTARLTFDACGAGVARLDLLGKVGGGLGPHVEITQGGRQLFSREVRGQQHHNVPIPGAGTVSLAYTNGYYRELADRNLLIDGLTFRPLADAQP